MRKEEPDWDPSSWYESFIDRHKDKLIARAVKELKLERANPDIEDHFQDFVEFFGDWFTSKGLSVKLLLNADECRVSVGNDQHSSKKIESTAKSSGSAIEATKTKCVSYYVAVHSGVGELIISFYVLPINKNGNSNFYLEHLEKPTRNGHPTYFGFSDTGYVNREIWLEILKKLKARLEILYPGLESCLLLDQLNFHMDDDTLKYCLDNGIHVVFFPTHSSHIIQPSDNRFFQVFKGLVQKKLQQKLLAARPSARDLGAELVGIAQEVELQLTSEVILASWCNIGVYPWNPQLIMERVKLNSGKAPIAKSHDSDPAKFAREATMDVLKEVISEDTKKKVKVKVQKGRLFSDEEVYQLSQSTKKAKLAQQELKEADHEKRIQEKEARKKAKEEKKMINCCRCGCHNDQDRPLWRGKKRWKWSETCMNFGLCDACLETCESVMLEHEAACSKNSEKN